MLRRRTIPADKTAVVEERSRERFVLAYKIWFPAGVFEEANTQCPVEVEMHERSWARGKDVDMNVKVTENRYCFDLCEMPGCPYVAERRKMSA